eukprot:s2617_g4.t1
MFGCQSPQKAKKIRQAANRVAASSRKAQKSPWLSERNGSQKMLLFPVAAWPCTDGASLTAASKRRRV